ncbi:MAG: rhodanese-like domain-containing protein [Bdellovibrionaceae bacterium]|nr:rhodanese-like domain-containing protein [Pseudobdellovibrionaceae bacterium]
MSFSTFAAPNCAEETSYPEITKTDLQTQIKNKSAYVIDVNGTKSFTKRHIDTAVNYENIKSDFAKSLPKDKTALVVAYCGGPSCVAWKQAAEEACHLGYTNVKHFKDGIKGW